MSGWHCHDCPTEVPTLAAARRHSKSAPPVFAPGGRILSHKLTRDAEAAERERSDRTARWAK